MAKKLVWLLVSCLMVLSLIMTSCNDDGADDDGGDDGTPGIIDNGDGNDGGDDGGDDGDNGDGDDGTPVAAEKPQYGGNLVILTNADITTWNPAAVGCNGAGQGGYAIEQILGIDFTKGPAGTGETNFIGGVVDYRYLGGNLAESWETPEVGVWVLNIRQGVHFYNHPDQEASQLVAGREMTAEDVAYSIEYMRDNTTSSSCNEPGLMQNLTVELTGEWQVTVNTPVAPTTGYLWIMGGGGAQYVWPKEFLDAYGTSNEWYDVVGTGPYMLDDYVPGVVGRYIKNDNYWDVNPVGPGKGDKLPYIDTVTYQIVPDYSTRLAALRTGRADWSYIDSALPREDFQTLLKSNPDIMSVQTIIAPQQVAGRIDLDGPYSDKRVRQAMMMAIDYPTIVEDFYDGQAELIDSPARKYYPSVYTPLEELPEAVQELYSYNPTKAKDLLSEAGYPDGFQIKMVMTNSTASEEASAIIKNYWSKIGIDVELSVLEPTVFTGLWVGHDSEDLVLSAYPGGDASLFVRYSLGYYRGPNIFNMSHVNDPAGTDPIIEKAFEDQSTTVMVDYPAADQVLKDVIPYILEQAFLIPMPAPWGYRVWQPWVKNYYGANDVKFWLRWAWIDQDLKDSMSN